MNHHTSTTMTASLCLIMSAMCSTVALAQFKYHVIAIAPGSAQGVNDKGDVVGTLAIGVKDTYYKITHAFLYKNGKITDLGVYNTPQAPYYESTAGEAVNNSDIVVGDISNPGGPEGGVDYGAFDAFLWQKGTMIDIAQGTSDGGASADAVTINNRGDVSGSYDAGPTLYKFFGYSHGFIYRNGLLTDLGTLGGWFSYGYGINNADQVVGIATALPGYASSYEAFLWTNGTMKAIGGGQSTNFTPEAINDNGWITGTLRSAAGNGYDKAVLYINGQFITLGTPQGFLGSEGVSINSIGIVAGNLLGTITYSGGTYTGVTGGFVYDGKMYNLNELLDGDWQIVSVGHINDFGQIAATGTMRGSTVTYALLLTPSFGLRK
jgi:probable HAF family extracellular repeat protein